MSDEANRLPRISLTKGIEVFCDQCGAVAFVSTQVEALHEASEHKKKHREQ